MFRKLPQMGLLLGLSLVFAEELFAQPVQGPRFPQNPQSPISPPMALEALRPTGADYTAESLRRFHRAFQAQYGGTARDVPLAAKAEHLEWALVRYHWTPFNQINPRVILPEQIGPLPEYRYGADISTWNGTFLAALSY